MRRLFLLAFAPFVLSVLAVLPACGGEAPPPQAPRQPDPPLDNPPVAAADNKAPPALSSGDVQRGTKLLSANDLAGAKAAFEEALRKNAKDAEAMYYLGLVAEKSQDKAGAEKGYRDALRARPDLDAAATNLGALLVEAQRFDEAILVLRAAASRQKDSPELHLNLGVALASKGDREGATKAFDQALKLAPKDPVYLVNYAQWLGQWKDVDGALSRLKAAQALAEKDVGLLAAVGFEMKEIHAFPDCIAVFDKVIAMKDAAETRTYRALCKSGAGDRPGAVADLTAAVKKDAKYGPAHFALGNQHAQAGRFKEALEAYETYLKVEPNGPLAKQAEERAKLAKSKIKK